jgi:hypothetical protein
MSQAVRLLRDTRRSILTVLEAAIVVAIGVILIATVAFLIRCARRGGKVIQVVGGGLTLMTMGNIRDPGNERVEIAKHPRKTKSGETGDPPSEQ